MTCHTHCLVGIPFYHHEEEQIFKNPPSVAFCGLVPPPVVSYDRGLLRPLPPAVCRWISVARRPESRFVVRPAVSSWALP